MKEKIIKFRYFIVYFKRNVFGLPNNCKQTIFSTALELANIRYVLYTLYLYQNTTGKMYFLPGAAVGGLFAMTGVQCPNVINLIIHVYRTWIGNSVKERANL